MTRLLIVLSLLTVSACTPTKLVTRTQTIEVPVLRYVPLRADWIANVPAPPKPAMRCIWEGSPTLCLQDLADWRAEYDAALSQANADKAAIRKVQPK